MAAIVIDVHGTGTTAKPPGILVMCDCGSMNVSAGAGDRARVAAIFCGMVLLDQSSFGCRTLTGPEHTLHNAVDPLHHLRLSKGL